jgi:D-amino-acid oxidase
VRVIVVGAGVIGLSVAVRLRELGVAADVVAREPPQETTSAVAAALWYPYRALPEDRVTAWSARTYDALSALAREPGAGVRLRAGLEMMAENAPDPWWGHAVPDLRRTPEGLRFTAPVVDMAVHLPWLVTRLWSLGGELALRAVDALDAVEADAVVNCTGLGARELAGDDALVAVRGQVVRVQARGVREWRLDQRDPGQPVYVVPREDEVILGGTAEEGVEDPRPDPQITRAILERCERLVPELRGAPVRGVAVGLRPVRPEVRLEADGRVVHCYGHGGAGVTLAWGCAVEVAALLGATRAPSAGPR